MQKVACGYIVAHYCYKSSCQSQQKLTILNLGVGIRGSEGGLGKALPFYPKYFWNTSSLWNFFLCPKLAGPVESVGVFPFFLCLILASLPCLSIFAPLPQKMQLHTLMLRRKKVGKVFPVKISTMDAELEFSLDYKVIELMIIFFFVDNQYFSRQLDRNSLILSVGPSGWEKPGRLLLNYGNNGFRPLGGSPPPLRAHF